MSITRIAFMTKELLYKFFNGACSPQEAAEVVAYLQGDDQSVLDEYIQWLAEQKDELPGRMSAEESAGLLQSIRDNNSTSEATVITIRRRWQTQLIKAVACIAVLLVTASVIYTSTRSRKPVPTTAVARVLINNPAQAVKKISMPDGTMIWLNRGSSMEYDKNQYNRQERLVAISGEVFFDVAHDPAKPFRVRAGEVTTTVLGTAFNIEAYPGEANTRVTLVRGRLKIDASSNEFLLSPGQMMTYNYNRRSMDVSDVETSGTAGWINGSLVFNDLPLADVFKRLESTFGIHISSPEMNTLQGKYLTGTYTDKDAEAILKKIVFIHDIKYVRKGNHYVINP